MSPAPHHRLASPPATIGRRRFLALGGASVLGAGLVLVGCGSDESTTSSSSSPSSPPSSSSSSSSSSTPSSTSAADTTAENTVATTADTVAPVSTVTETQATVSSTVADLSTGTPPSTVFTVADFADLGTCTLLPDLTQGPFPTLEQIERRDITEGHAGHPLRVGVRVVDDACAPIPGAVVEIWHCDIDGDYSAYADGYTDDDAGAGTTFFRGSQTADDDGIVEFVTSYPGWYTGRAVHIHAKVHIDDATVLTTQFFFDDELNEEIFTESVYAAHGDPDTTNETDSIAGGDPEAAGTLLFVSDDPAIAGSRALIVVGVDPTATSAGASGGMGGGMGGSPGGPPG